ncbi:Dynein intermediate chain 3, axonemal [Frankliniella fusca]|uniref:Dynein intermediate chain 3, axonemal n=1 Tax=Frankliniella fusca TaxID=407009 RepID=A0AAE1HUW3_9NEOP|nr:Dynein intermediate chain 3, axonemal [Frankliniella fusca]
MSNLSTPANENLPNKSDLVPPNPEESVDHGPVPHHSPPAPSEFTPKLHTDLNSSSTPMNPHQTEPSVGGTSRNLEAAELEHDSAHHTDVFQELFKTLEDGVSPKVTDKPKKKTLKTKKKKGKVKSKGKKKGKKKKKAGKKKKGKKKKKKKPSAGLLHEHRGVTSEMATTPVGSEHGGGSGMSLVPGVMRVTLSPDTQHHLGCVVGKHVTAESPWVFVNKSLIDDNLDLHSESSDFLPVREDISDFKSPTVLLGYDVSADADNQFYICVTETAQTAVVEILKQIQEDQQNWLKNALEKPARPWESLGSDQEVDLFTIKQSRPLMQMQVETTVGDLRAPCNFSVRNVDDVPDGYFHFPHRDDLPEHITRLRIDKVVQVSLPKIDVEAQTEPGIPDNSWTQYEYSVDTDNPIEDEAVEQALAKFMQGVQNEICDALHYNELMDLHRDDYCRLVRYEEDTETSQSIQYNEFMSFTDMKHCQGKIVSCAAFHPTCSGIVALAYVDHAKTEISEEEESPDDLARNVYAMHPILVWSFVDAFRPKLILDCARKVHALAYAPQNGNILVAGLSNGQIAIFDLTGKIERVEQETKMTPDQVKYHMAMNNLMDWMKCNNRVEYLQPTAVSAIDGSHVDMVTQVIWLNPSWEINSTGQFLACEEGRQSLQLVSSSVDGSILFWNLDPDAVSIPGIIRKRRLSKRPTGLKTEKSPFSNFNRKLKPVFKLEIQGPDEKRLYLAMCISFYTQPVFYEEDPEFSSKLTQAQRESMTTRFKFKPVHPPPEIHEQKNSMMVGTVNGSILRIEWEGTEDTLADFVLAKRCSSIAINECHASPVFTLKRNPFIQDLYLSVGTKKFALWSEKLGMAPLLWRNAEDAMYTDGAWSLQRPSMFQIIRKDGTIEVWDLLTRSDTFILTQSVSGKILTGIDAHTQYLPNNVVGVADYNGSYRLFFIPSQYQESDLGSDIQQMEKLIDREKDRRKSMDSWVARWREKNTAQVKLLREQKELEHRKEMELQEHERQILEEKQKQEEIELEQIQNSRKMIDQLKQRDPPKHIAKVAAMEQRWQETRRTHMVRMLLDKKKLEKSELERRRGPFVAAQEAHDLKTLKLRQVLRQGPAIFRETVKTLFPEVVKVTTQKPTKAQALAAQLEDMDETFVERYFEIEKLALEQLLPTPLENSFNWKRTVQEGRSRREVLDISLFHQTARMARAEERREYRHLHRNSEMQREDEKKKAKSKAKVGFLGSSSQLPESVEADNASGDPGAMESISASTFHAN